MSVPHLSAIYVPEVVVVCGQYEGGGGEVCLFCICLLSMCQKWWWSVVNIKEVEERFVCSASVCYLCARSGGGVWSI